LEALDVYLFHLINQIWTHSFFDVLFPLWRNKLFWSPLYLFLASFLWVNYKRKGLWIILCLALTVAVSDFVSSAVIKPLVKRERPCNDKHVFVRKLITCGPGKSFPSSHATNHFAVAFFLSMIFGYKRRWVWLLSIFWAASISYGQVYVGVHYHFDVFFGGFIGSSLGILGAFFCQKVVILEKE
jgi:undecaprenyl-diphosphatase